MDIEGNVKNAFSISCLRLSIDLLMSNQLDTVDGVAACRGLVMRTSPTRQITIGDVLFGAHGQAGSALGTVIGVATATLAAGVTIAIYGSSVSATDLIYEGMIIENLG